MRGGVKELGWQSRVNKEIFHSFLLFLLLEIRAYPQG